MWYNHILPGGAMNAWVLFVRSTGLFAACFTAVLCGAMVARQQHGPVVRAPDDRVQVVYAKRELVAGDPIPASALARIDVPAHVLVPVTGVPYVALAPRSVVTDLRSVVGLAPSRRVLPGEILWREHLVPAPGTLAP